ALTTARPARVTLVAMRQWHWAWSPCIAHFASGPEAPAAPATSLVMASGPIGFIADTDAARRAPGHRGMVITVGVETLRRIFSPLCARALVRSWERASQELCASAGMSP